MARRTDEETTTAQASMPVRLIVNWLTNAIVLGIVALVLNGVHVNDVGSLLAAAAVFGLLNTFVKPVLRLITAPLALITFGIAWFFVSLLMLVITRAIVSGFQIHGFGSLVAATVVVWLVNVGLELIPGPWQITGSRRRRRKKDD
jgi:putative membrane protein